MEIEDMWSKAHEQMLWITNLEKIKNINSVTISNQEQQIVVLKDTF